MKIFLILTIFALVKGESIEYLTDHCKSQYNFFANALNNYRQWAMELYDTWGKFQHGMLNGNSLNFGDYDRCIDFSYDITISSVGRIQGKYFLVTFELSQNVSWSINMDMDFKEIESLSQINNLKLTTGICLPATCNRNDGRVIAEVLIFKKFNVDVTNVESISRREIITFRMRILAIVIFSLLLLTTLSSTIYELVMIHREKKPSGIITWFSIYSNGKNLFAMTTKEGENARSIQCLDGLRALSLLWIIFGHRYFDMFTAPASNAPSATSKWLANILSLSHTTFHLAVDTFLLMGGLLAMMSFMRSFDRGNFNIFKIYFHRFLRYTPVLLFLLLFFVSFMTYMGSGPIYDKTLDNWMPNCYNFWWSSLFHVATYTNIDRLCLNWTWYLSCDFQLFIITPILAYPAWRWRWKFFSAFPIVILLSQIYIFIVSYVYKFLVFVGPLQTVGQYDYDRLLYYPTHGRCGSWLVGMTLGFIMYENRDRTQRLNRHLTRLLWISSITILLLIVLGYFQFQQSELYFNYPNLHNSLYNAAYRHLWAMSIGWIIYGCHNNSGGIVSWLLSLSYFRPIAKMSLSIYLTHRVHQIISIASIRQPIYIQPYEIFQVYLSDVLMSLFVGSVVYLTVEAPFANLENRLFNRKM